MSRNCPKRSICEKCHEHHPSCLHDDYCTRDTKDHTDVVGEYSGIGTSAKNKNEEDRGNESITRS